jgi:uncharacterized membrane protein YqiK
VNALVPAEHFIGDREILEARARAEAAPAEAELATRQAVECATRAATQAEQPAIYWAAVAHRVACQRGGRHAV